MSLIPRPSFPLLARILAKALAPALAFALTFVAAMPAAAALNVNADGTVTDTTTGLVWDRCVYGLTGATCNSGTALYSNWTAGLNTAKAANAAGYKGFNDWRLPNVKELESIVIVDANHPSWDTTAFPYTIYIALWTSTSYAPNVTKAWIVDFSNGSTFANLTTNPSSVRLVRGGQALAAFDLLPAPNLSALGTSGTTTIASTLNATSDMAATGYWLAVPAGATAPTGGQIQAGVAYTGGAVVTAGSGAMTAGTAASFAVSGLSAGTAYDLYVVAVGVGPASVVGGPVHLTTVTDAAAVPTLSQWGLLFLSLLLALGAGLLLERRTSRSRL